MKEVQLTKLLFLGTIWMLFPIEGIEIGTHLLVEMKTKKALHVSE
jgi:hypothetical protein